jgi:hypothetical protein
MPNDNLDPDYVPVIKGGMSLADLGKCFAPPKLEQGEPPPEPQEEQSAAAALLAKLGA